MSIMYNPHNNKFMLKRRQKEEVKRGKSLLKYHWGLYFLQPHSIWKAATATRRKTLSLSLFAELFMLLGVNPRKWIESYKVWIYWITQVFPLFFVCSDFALRKYFGFLQSPVIASTLFVDRSWESINSDYISHKIRFFLLKIPWADLSPQMRRSNPPGLIWFVTSWNFRQCPPATFCHIAENEFPQRIHFEIRVKRFVYWTSLFN